MLFCPNPFPSAIIFGCSGPVLSPEERAFFQEANPVGFILFSWNLETKTQTQRLIQDLKSLSGRTQVPILIDEEGGRVTRLPASFWPAYPSAEFFDHLYQKDPEEACTLCFLNYRKMAQELKELGITVNCAPVLDLLVPHAHHIIGDRSFGTSAQQVFRLGHAAIRGLQAGGIIPVMKHIPGHGAALVDSHEALPHVLLSTEQMQPHLFPFQGQEAQASAVLWAMTAHILYEAFDSEHCATFSSAVIQKTIREKIGFNGFLISDDLQMKAVSGTPQEKVTKALDAGCDAVLYCKGGVEEFQNALKGARPLTPASYHRLEQSFHFSF